MLLGIIGIWRKPAWVAAVSGLGTAFIVAILVFEMPLGLAVSATTFGAAQGLFPIGWIVYWAIVMYRITLDTGKFEVIKDSIGGLTTDRRLQAMLIAFAFGAFIEGASGFGTPVAVAAAMLAGLGFSPFFAAGICLLANTAPVAFGSIGIPVVTLANVTGLPEL
ncbi:MAG: L-lactate permease, partial [Burkholderiales bacterium]